MKSPFLSKQKDNCSDCCLCQIQWTRLFRDMSCPPYSHKTMYYVGKYHILGSGGTVLYLFCRYGMQIMFHCNLLGILITVLVDMWCVCQKEGEAPFIINPPSSRSYRTKIMTHKRERILTKRITITKINLFDFRKTLNKAQEWFC